jgi:hypothetical protein
VANLREWLPLNVKIDGVLKSNVQNREFTVPVAPVNAVTLACIRVGFPPTPALILKYPLKICKRIP